MYHNTLIYSWAGKTINISCNIHAYPLPAVDWVHNNMILTNNATYHLHQLNTYHYLQVILSLDYLIQLCEFFWLFDLYFFQRNVSTGQ